MDGRSVTKAMKTRIYRRLYRLSYRGNGNHEWVPIGDIQPEPEPGVKPMTPTETQRALKALCKVCKCDNPFVLVERRETNAGEFYRIKPDAKGEKKK